MNNTAPRLIAECMTASPVSIGPRQSLFEAQALMHSLGVRHLPVVEERRLIGVLSQSDLRLFESQKNARAMLVQVEEAMVQCPYAVGPDEPAAAVLDHMLKHRIGSALIVERGRLIGIFTAVDAIACLRRMVAGGDADREPAAAAAGSATAG